MLTEKEHSFMSMEDFSVGDSMFSGLSNDVSDDDSGSIGSEVNAPG